MAILSWFTHWKWWFSIVMLVYQRVIRMLPPIDWNPPMWRSYPKVTCKKDLYPKSLLCIPNFVAILLAGGCSLLIKAIGNPLSIVLLIIVIVTATPSSSPWLKAEAPKKNHQWSQEMTHRFWCFFTMGETRKAHEIPVSFMQSHENSMKIPRISIYIHLYPSKPSAYASTVF